MHMYYETRFALISYWLYHNNVLQLLRKHSSCVIYNILGVRVCVEGVCLFLGSSQYTNVLSVQEFP